MIALAPLLLPPPITIAAVGDLMLGSDYPNASSLPPAGSDLLRAVAPVLRKADLTFGNLEGPLTTGGTTRKRGPTAFAFRSPPANAARLAAAGFDVLSVANNHAGDFGILGRASTRAALAKARMSAVGAKGEIVVRTVRGVTVAFVAFAHSPFSDHVSDLATARHRVMEAAKRARIVVVSFHGGAEGSGASRLPQGRETYMGEDRGDLRRFAHTVVDAGADLVIGHGPHVPRAMELYRGRLVAYSLGNFCTYGHFNLSGPAALAPLLRVKLSPRDGRFAGGGIVSARQLGGVPKLDPSGGAASEIQRLSKLDLPLTAVAIGPGGALSRSAPSGR